MKNDPDYPCYLKWLGGRKQLNGYIASVLITVMAYYLNADFRDYAIALLTALGLSSGLIAFEDIIRPKQPQNLPAPKSQE